VKDARRESNPDFPNPLLQVGLFTAVAQTGYFDSTWFAYRG
jgi:hypothetical protein